MQWLISQTTQRYIVIALHILALILTALHLYVAALPATTAALPTPADAESAWWGLWPITYVPSPLRWTGAALVLLSIGWGWWQIRSPQPTALPIHRRWLWLGAGMLFLSFWTFPIVHTRWGDAYILTNAISWPDPSLRLTHSWQAPLDVYLHSRVWHWLGDPMGWRDAAPVYRLLSPLAGGIYLWIVLQLSADRRLAPHWITFGLLTSLGLIQLFFGYIENYSFAAAGILAYLWLGMKTLLGERPLWLAATVLTITNATHPSTVVYAPSLLFVGMVCWWRMADGGPQTADRRSQTTNESSGATQYPIPNTQYLILHSTLHILTSIVLPMFVVAIFTVALMEMGGHGIAALLDHDRPGGGDGRWLVPLFETTTRWEHYTMFSWLHIRDLLNQQALTAPVVLPALLLGWIGTITARKRLTYDENWIEWAITRFLALAAGAHLLLITIWNPDYGGQRDWDLFSLAAIPTTLWLVWSLPRFLPDPRLRRAAVAPLILVQALHTAAWVYQNRLPWQWP
ncbi:MAG: hypothetical protein KF893_16110 [Caldilineaceae bacterium]|nr:hypothetical protein [Caldilineaceae bacterium]